MPELTGDRIQCLDCGNVGVDLEGPEEGESDSFDFECPECGHEASMDGPIGMPARGGPISDFGGDADGE